MYHQGSIHRELNETSSVMNDDLLKKPDMLWFLTIQTCSLMNLPDLYMIIEKQGRYNSNYCVLFYV